MTGSSVAVSRLSHQLRLLATKATNMATRKHARKI